MAKDLTFVLMTCGELTEKRCLAAIEPFRHKIEFLEVRNVYPQIKALNLMIQQVQTPYFIPLDADIVLNKGAWERIRSALNRHMDNPQWHTILFSLWDTLTQRRILALKVLRTSIMKANPFIESATPDVEHYQRLTSLGYTCIDECLRFKPIGKHIVKGKFFCYHKYRDVYQTYKSHWWEWDSGAFLGGDNLPERAKAHFHYFIYRWATTGNKDYLWCIAGMVDGILSDTQNKSKNLRRRKCTISAKAGIHLFMDWYMRHGEECQSAHYLF
jgi:hypothetical protein